MARQLAQDAEVPDASETSGAQDEAEPYTANGGTQKMRQI